MANKQLIQNHAQLRQLVQPAGSAALGGSKAVPYETLEAENEDAEGDDINASWTSWILNGFGPTPDPKSIYGQFAQACEYNGKISNLKEWAKIQKLKKTCGLYADILEYVKNSNSKRNCRVHQIYKIERKNERPAFTEPFRLLLWHGTNPRFIPQIIEHGFKKGVWGNFGPACYFADRFYKSEYFSWYNSKGRCLLILAEVAPGRLFEANRNLFYLMGAPPGFDSVKATGLNVPYWPANKQYNGAIMPSGPTVMCTRHPTYQRNFSEYVIFDESRIIVRFVVEVEFSQI